MSAGGKRNCRLWRWPPCDPAVSVVENVVVKDDRLLTCFMRNDRAGYRDVAHYVKDSVGFVHILRCVSTNRFGFRPTDVGEVVLFVTLWTNFVPGLAFLLPSLCIAAITMAWFSTISALDYVLVFVRLFIRGYCRSTRVLESCLWSFTSFFGLYKLDRVLQGHVLVVMFQYILLDVAVAKSSNESVTDHVVSVINCFKWVVRAVFRELADLSLTS